MKSFTVGCVPYVNARPLTHTLAAKRVEVVYDVPSRLPALLDSGRAQAVLASSFYALNTPGRTYVAGVSIATKREAQSVRLFSKVPFPSIESLALDQSSLTSNALARVVLADQYRASPACEVCPPDLTDMLRDHDAALLIGDPGMEASGDGLQVLDLGVAWSELTALPFVWALWIGDERLSPELAARLNEAAREGEAAIEDVTRSASADVKWGEERTRRYLSSVMSYGLDDSHIAGLRAFHDRLLRHGLVRNSTFPTAVTACLATT